MQTLYSYFSNPQNDLKIYEKVLLKDIYSISNLHVIIFSFLLELYKFAQGFLEDNKFKFIPTEEDLNPNTKFINNRVFSILIEDKELLKKVDINSRVLTKSDLDVIRKVFVKVIKSNQYNDYLNNDKDNLVEDKKFVQILLNEFILENDIFHHILQEKSIFWLDDLPFIVLFLKAQINNLEKGSSSSVVVDVFKNKEDKKFAIDLFRNTIKNSSEFDSIIERKVQNWEIDRIANMDLLFIKMALSEIVSFVEMPVKVSFNEYIEISKYYSTKNSKVFINGILDKIVSEFRSEGKIKKTGKGLV
tara:strand:+ start:924 stop:1832 length:909 start_codon:yes stop_codon:yes gene_type:complete